MIQNKIKLTKKQEDVLHWVVQGCSNKQVAQRLNITESTVKLHMGDIMKKYGVRSRTALAASAITNNAATVLPMVTEQKPIGYAKRVGKDFVGVVFGSFKPDETWEAIYLKLEE